MAMHWLLLWFDFSCPLLLVTRGIYTSWNIAEIWDHNISAVLKISAIMHERDDYSYVPYSYSNLVTTAESEVWAKLL